MVQNKLSILIPVYKLVDDRLDNFKYILKKIVEANITNTILVYEQVRTDENKTDVEKITDLYENVTYKSEIIKDELIHKSFLINKGVEMLDTEFIWVNDADCYLKFKHVYDIISTGYEVTEKHIPGKTFYVAPIASIMDEHDFIQPFAIAKRLTKEETVKLRNDITIDVNFSKELIKKDKPSFIQLYGALSFIFRKTAYEKIGGMDETFTGWGCEDSDFSARVYKYCASKPSSTSNIKILRTVAGVHLYHPMPTWAQRKDYCPNYQRNFKYFADKHDMTYFKLRQYIQDYHKKRPQITIINRPRTGSNVVKDTLVNGLNLPEESEPFSDRLRRRYSKDDNFSEAIEHIVNKRHIITHNLSTITNKKAQVLSTKELIRYSDVVIILTRKNFLDWITSMAVARDQTNYYGRVYEDRRKIEIPMHMFEKLFVMWYSWHTTEIYMYEEECKKNNIPVIVGDYDVLTDIRAIRSKILPLIDPLLDKTLFNIPTVKQKTKNNSDYISNYDEIVRLFNSLQNKEQTPMYQRVQKLSRRYSEQLVDQGN